MMSIKDVDKKLTKYLGLAAIIFATSTFSYNLYKHQIEYDTIPNVYYSYVIGVAGAYLYGTSRRKE